MAGRIPVSILIILTATLRAWEDFKPADIGTYLFFDDLTAMQMILVGFYLGMEIRRSKKGYEEIRRERLS